MIDGVQVSLCRVGVVSGRVVQPPCTVAPQGRRYLWRAGEVKVDRIASLAARSIADFGFTIGD